MAFAACLRKEILEQWRASRLLIVCVVLLLFGMTSPVMAKFMPEIFKFVPGAEQFAGLIPSPTVVDAIGQYVKNIGQFSILLALFVPMGAVAVEKERGTAALMLVKPVSRGSFLGAKFLALSLTFLVGFALAGTAAYYYTWFLFEPLDLGAWVAMNALLWVVALFYMSITLMFSTLVRSQAAAAGLGFAVLLLLAALDVLPNLAVYLPGQLTKWGVGGLVGASQASWPALWVCLGLMTAFFIIGWVVFERQEL